MTEMLTHLQRARGELQAGKSIRQPFFCLLFGRIQTINLLLKQLYHNLCDPQSRKQKDSDIQNISFKAPSLRDGKFRGNQRKAPYIYRKENNPCNRKTNQNQCIDHKNADAGKMLHGEGRNVCLRVHVCFHKFNKAACAQNQHAHDGTEKIDQHVHGDRVLNFPRFDKNKTEEAAQQKGVCKLIQIAVEEAEEQPRNHDGDTLAVADGALNQKLAEQKFLGDGSTDDRDKKCHKRV